MIVSMALYIAVAVVVSALAYMYKPTEYKTGRQRMLNIWAVAAIFIILTLLAALRLDVGNDYGTYVNTCHEIRWGGYVVTEPLFNIIVKYLYILSGSENYLLMFGVFGAAIVFVFLKAMTSQSDSFFWSVFLFMTLGIYYRSFNTVRYYLVLAVTLVSLKYVVASVTKDESGKIKVDFAKLITFLLIIGISALMHKSVLVVIPLYLICRLPWKKWVYGLIAVSGVALLVLQSQVMKIALILYPSYEGTDYIEEVRSISDNLPVIGRIVLVLILCAVCYKEAVADREDNKFYMKLSIIALVMYVSCYYIPFVTRFGYYLVTAQILLIPNIIMSVSDAKKKKVVCTAVALIAVLYFGLFLKTADRMGVRVLPYQSFLFTSKEYLTQEDIPDQGLEFIDGLEVPEEDECDDIFDSLFE